MKRKTQSARRERGSLRRIVGQSTRWATSTVDIGQLRLYKLRFWPDNFEYPTEAESQRGLGIAIKEVVVMAKSAAAARKIGRACWEKEPGHCELLNVVVPNSQF